MSAVTISSARLAAPSGHDHAAAAIGPAYGLVVRLMRRAVARHVRIRTARQLRALPAEIRHDIGVAEHVIEDFAAEVADRKADAMLRRLFGGPAGRLAG